MAGHYGVLALSHHYLVNAVRGHKTVSNNLEWKTTSGGEKKTPNIYEYVREYMFFPPYSMGDTSEKSHTPVGTGNVGMYLHITNWYR